MTKIRVAYIVGCLDRGGQERQLYYLLQKIKPERFKVILFVWDLSKVSFYYPLLPNHIQVKGFNPNSKSFLKLFIFCYHVLLFKPDIIHSFAWYLNRVAEFGVRFSGTHSKSIGALRSSFEFMLTKFPISLIKRNFFNPDVIHVNSQKSANELKGFLTEAGLVKQIFQIPNGLDTEMFPPKSPVRNITETLKMVSVGRMIDTKEYPDQLKLVKSLYDEGVEVTHTIVGYGKEEKFIRQSIDDLGLNDQVTVVNSASDVAKYYHRADVFIQTSSTEGLPNVILEAMSCGLCCFATNVGDTGRIIESGENGFLFDVHDIEGMKKKIMELWKPGNENNFRKICDRATKRVNQQFSLQANYQAVLSMYNSITNNLHLVER